MKEGESRNSRNIIGNSGQVWIVITDCFQICRLPRPHIGFHTGRRHEERTASATEYATVKEAKSGWPSSENTNLEKSTARNAVKKLSAAKTHGISPKVH